MQIVHSVDMALEIETVLSKSINTSVHNINNNQNGIHQDYTLIKNKQFTVMFLQGFDDPLVFFDDIPQCCNEHNDSWNIASLTHLIVKVIKESRLIQTQLTLSHQIASNANRFR
jgi:hypothetical protein